MTLTASEIDKIAREIRDYFRQESATVQIQKIKPNFYERAREAIESLDEMARNNISPERIDMYRKVMDKRDIIEKNIRNFLLKRYEKILRDSLFEIGSSIMDRLTSQEKIFIMDMHNRMALYIDGLIQVKNIAQKEEIEPVEEITTVGPYHEKTEEGKHMPEATDPMNLVSVTAEYLPVATSIGDFYLHKNDILYLPVKAAELIIEKKYARYVDFSKKIG
jgi:hypothetical protein